jgi:Flp pilus assembly protein TadD
MPSQDINAADVMQIASNELVAHGHAAQGREIGEQLVSWLRGRPAAEQNDTVLISALLSAGNKVEARNIAKRLVAKNPRDVEALALDGITAAYLGDRAAAERASAALGALDTPYLLGDNVFNQAEIAAVLGRKDRAVEYLRESIRRGTSSRQVVHDHQALVLLQGYPAYDELMRPRG